MEVVTKIQMEIPLWGLIAAAAVVVGWGYKTHFDLVYLKKDMKEMKELLYHFLPPKND